MTQPIRSATTMFPRLGFGLGLRTEHYQDVLAGEPHVDWWEVISENFLVAGGNPRRVLRQVCDRWPVVLHGVSLSIGSADPVDDDYLARLAALVAEVDPPFVSDHLCWSALGGQSGHDLWPLPYTEEALAVVVDKVGRVQDRLGRRILLENPSSYVTFAASQIAEGEFLAELARRADCGILLDVNNVYVSCTNHGWDPDAYLAAIPPERVAQIHLAGHSDHGTHLLDTHDHPVCDAVWALYRQALARFGEVSSMIERDDHIPALGELLDELDHARQIAGAALTARSASSADPEARAAEVRGSASRAPGATPRELQQRFFDRVTAGVACDGLTASGDLAVYAGMYASRLVDSLAEDYPKLRTALGEVAFAALAADYLRAHPPRSFTLRDAGLALAEHLRARALVPPWAADLAALERARLEVFDGPDAAPLGRAEAIALADGLPELVLSWVPSSAVVTLGWTVDALWSAIEDADDAHDHPAPVPASRSVLVWRRDVAVLHRTLDGDEAALAPQIAIGTRFADVCEVLGALHGEAAGARGVELLLRWLDSEAIVRP